MKEWFGPIMGAAAALSGVALNHYLSRNKAVNDKIWEKKLELYNLIVSTLFYSVTKFKNFQRYREEDCQRAYADEDSSSVRDDAWRMLYETFDTSVKHRLLISLEFRAILSKAQEKLAALPPDADPPDRDDCALNTLPSVLIDLTRQAESELRR